MPELDATEVGVQAARVMEDLEQAALSGDLGTNPRVLAAMVIYEVRNDEDESTVGARTTDDRSVVGLGLLDRAQCALRDPDGDLSSD